MLYLIYSDDQGASVSIDTVIAASQKQVGKYQSHISEWTETSGEHPADTDPLHKKVCFDITGGKRYFNMDQFDTYVKRHNIISYGLVNMQRELRQLTGGTIMWTKISEQRVRDLLAGMSKKERKRMKLERQERHERERKKNQKPQKQSESLMKRLRRI